MKKSSIMMLALSGTMLVGCTQSEYIGEAPQQNGKIVFSGASGKMTRATSNTGTIAQMLDDQIKFYGVKKTGETYSSVFENYVLWSQTDVTTSNPDANQGDQFAWEYVGPETQEYGSDKNKIGKAQYIKYWDYSASEYNFVAGSPVEAFTYNVTDDNKIESATVTGIAGHLNPSNTKITTNPIYIANPVRVEKTAYNNSVTFNFVRQQSFVRVGVFETIPGYKITAINFYQYNATDGSWGASPYSEQNIILASASKDYFTGATNATATVTYNWGKTPSYTFAYTAGTTFKQQNNWFGGKLSGVPATTSTEAAVDKLYGTDEDMAENGYFTVLPTNSATTADALLVKCDYTLQGLDGNDIINVKGATAAIPAAYAKWAPNTSYTYLFKISDNTNGTTGVGGDPEGLFPITFDAVVVKEEDGTAQGTVTTVSTPSITTYQEGFADEMKYVAGEAIYVTAQNDMTGDLEVLTDKVKVFALDGAKTEADLILKEPTTGVTPCVVGNTDATVGDVTFTANKYGMFTPADAGYYAIQCKYTDSKGNEAFAYKVVEVK